VKYYYTGGLTLLFQLLPYNAHILHAAPGD
jgi:hypothetical protein